MEAPRAEAIRHAIAGEDLEHAADLAELAWPAMSGAYQSIQWLGWVKDLPDEVTRVRPILSLSYAYALLNAGKLEAAESRLIDTERLLDVSDGMSERLESSSAKITIVDKEQFRSLPFSLVSARAYHAQAIGDVTGTVKYTQRMLDLSSFSP